MDKERESIIGIRWSIIDGVRCLVQDIRYADGTIKEEVVEFDKNDKKIDDDFTDRFKNDTFKPESLVAAKTDVLIRKSVAKEFNGSNGSITDVVACHIERSYKIHALLVKVLGCPNYLSEQKSDVVINNSAVYELVMDIIDIVGQPWSDLKDLIILKKDK